MLGIKVTNVSYSVVYDTLRKNDYRHIETYVCAERNSIEIREWAKKGAPKEKRLFVKLNGNEFILYGEIPEELSKALNLKERKD